MTHPEATACFRCGAPRVEGAGLLVLLLQAGLPVAWTCCACTAADQRAERERVTTRQRKAAGMMPYPRGGMHELSMLTPRERRLQWEAAARRAYERRREQLADSYERYGRRFDEYLRLMQAGNYWRRRSA